MRVQFLLAALSMNKSKPHLILASASIGRKGLLEKLGVPFTVLPSSIDEETINDLDPKVRLINRARAKAEDVLKQLPSRFPLSPSPYLIIAADSEAILNEKTYGKSRNRAHAKEIVSALMGHTHDFYTATCIIKMQNNQEKNRWEDLTLTKVSMRNMSSQELNEYISGYDFTRFAAGYTLNETPWDLITKVEGSYTNVIGLPFEVILPIFRRMNLF